MASLNTLIYNLIQLHHVYIKSSRRLTTDGLSFKVESVFAIEKEL